MDESVRAAILDKEIQNYVWRGYRVVSRTPTTVQLVKPKQFSLILAILGLLIAVVGLVIYLLIYASMKDSQVYLTVDEKGHIHRL